MMRRFFHTIVRSREPFIVALRFTVAFGLLSILWIAAVDGIIIPDAYSPGFEDRATVREVGLIVLAAVVLYVVTRRMSRAYRGGDVSVPLSLLERDGGTEALRLTEEQWRLMVETLREHAIFRLDTAGQVVSWDEHAERITGYTRDEILGRSYDILFTKDDRETGKPDDLLKLAAVQESVTDDGWRVKSNGNRFFATIMVLPLRSNNTLTGFVQIIEDSTERLKILNNLLRSEQRYRALFEQLPLPAWIYRLSDLKILAVNKAAEDVSGMSREELVGMSMRDLQVGDDPRRLHVGVPPSSGGLIAAAGTWQLRRKDDSSFRADISAQPILYNNEPAELILARSVTGPGRSS